MIQRAAAALLLLALSAASAGAQVLCPTFEFGKVLTPAQWNACFDGKQNALGYTPVNKAGDSMSGKLITAIPTTTAAGLNLPHGAAPTSPVNGDMWTTAGGLFIRVSGVTVGPLGTGGGGTTVLPDSQIFVGNAGNVATAVALSGDATISNVGALTVTRINGVALGSTTATAGNVLVGSGTNWVSATISGDATLSSSGALTVTRINGASVGTATPTSGNLLVGSGTAWVTHAMSGDATISSTGAIAVTKTGGVSFAASATTDTTVASNISSGTMAVARLPVATSGALGILRPDNVTITISGGVISTVTSGASLTVGATNITSGTTGRVLYDNAGVLSEYPITGTAGSVVLSASPSITTPTMSSPTFSGTVAGANTIPLSILAQSGAASLVGNATASTANNTAFTLQGLSDISTPSATLDFLLIYNHTTGTLQKTTATELVAAVGTTVTSIGGMTGVITCGSGLTCSAGSISVASAPLVVGTTNVTGGTSTYFLNNNAGVLGNIQPTGTGLVVLQTSPSIASPTLTGTVAGTNVIPLTVLAQAGAATLIGNATAGTANATAFTIQGLTNITTPNATLDLIPIYNHTSGTIQYTNASQITSAVGSGVTSLGGLTGVITCGSGVTCAGGSISVAGGGSTVTVGTTTVASGTTTRILYDNAGTLGEYSISGSGTTVAMNTGPTISALVVTGSFTATGLVGNAALANSSMTIGGQSIALGGTTTNQGTGGKLQLATGTTTTNDLLSYNAAGDATDSGILKTAVVLTSTTLGGDLSGTLPNPTVAKINGVALGTTTATSGNLLIGNGTTWVSVAMSGDITITSAGVTAIGSGKTIASPTFTGTVGGTGVIPNSVLVNSSITIGGQATALGGSTTNQGTGGKLQLASGTTATDDLLAYNAAGDAIDSGILKGNVITSTLSLSGDLTGSLPNATVAKINTVALGTTTATAGNILVGSGSAWVTNAVSGDVTLSATGVAGVIKIAGATLGTVTPTGGNLLIGSGTAWVTNAISGDATLSSAGVVAVTKINGSTLGVTTPTSGNILIGTGAAWITVNMSGDATITSGGVVSIGAGRVTLTQMANLTANSVIGNATAGAAVPTALAMPSCSTGTSALIWTTSTGFGCNSITSGGVSTVSVVSANGFTGSVANPTTTPAITITTSITGILQGNGTAMSAITVSSGLSFSAGALTAPGNFSSVRVVTAAGAVTVTSTDSTVVINKTSGAATTANLPSSPATGLRITIKDGKCDSATNNITITPAAGNIDGASTLVMAANCASSTLIYNGTQWNQI